MVYSIGGEEGSIRAGSGGLSGNLISGSGNFGPPQEVKSNNAINVKNIFFIVKS